MSVFYRATAKSYGKKKSIQVVNGVETEVINKVVYTPNTKITQDQYNLLYKDESRKFIKLEPKSTPINRNVVVEKIEASNETEDSESNETEDSESNETEDSESNRIENFEGDKTNLVTIDQLKEIYTEEFNKDIPKRFANDFDWINKQLNNKYTLNS